MTSCDYFNATSLHSRDCKVTTWDMEWMHWPMHPFWSDHFVLNTEAVTLSAFPTQGTLQHCYPVKWIENLALKTNFEP